DSGAYNALHLLLQTSSIAHQRATAKYLYIDAPLARRQLPVGYRVDNKYELIGCLRQGGMADVYTTKDLRTGGLYALKLLPVQYMREPSVVHRFQQEVAYAIQLGVTGSPNVVTVVDQGSD